MIDVVQPRDYCELGESTGSVRKLENSLAYAVSASPSTDVTPSSQATVARHPRIDFTWTKLRIKPHGGVRRRRRSAFGWFFVSLDRNREDSAIRVTGSPDPDARRQILGLGEPQRSPPHGPWVEGRGSG